MTKYQHGFMVSRFQPFHNGHRSLLDKMLNECNHATLILGSAQESRTAKNPFNVEERIFMIKNVYGNLKKLDIFCINDIPNDNKWYDHVMLLLKENSKKYRSIDAYYCGSADDGKWFDDGYINIEVLDRTKQEGYLNISGTEIRDMIRNNDISWKNYIPEQNVDFVENFFEENYLL